MTVIETAMFQRYAARVWRDGEREEFAAWLAEHPEAGDVISGAAPLRKVRWSRAGMGKRGGTRVIYFVTREDGTITLLIVYPKSETENLSSAFLRELWEMNKERNHAK